jgi:hypothetical protein
LLPGVLCIRESFLLWKTANLKYGVELFVNFFPILFILGTASPFYAARRDKNGGKCWQVDPRVTCRCEGRQLAASEAILRAAMA